MNHELPIPAEPSARMLAQIQRILRRVPRILVVLASLWFVLTGWGCWMNRKQSLSTAKGEPMLREIDWEERGFDPAIAGLIPEVIALAGTYESSNRHGYFEVKMRGRDLYLRREWNTGHWWRWEIESVVTNQIRNRSVWWRGMGWGGGGGGGDYGQSLLVVARSLWASNGFVGATEEQLGFIDKAHQRSEEFGEIKQVGPYRIPMKIRFTDRNGEKVYHIKKVLFTNQPGIEWFVDEPWSRQRVLQNQTAAGKPTAEIQPSASRKQ